MFQADLRSPDNQIGIIWFGQHRSSVQRSQSCVPSPQSYLYYAFSFCPPATQKPVSSVKPKKTRTPAALLIPAKNSKQQSSAQFTVLSAFPKIDQSPDFTAGKTFK
jgi:hypothetical protein